MNRLQQAIYASVSAIAVVCATGAAYARSEAAATADAEKIQWNIPPQPLADALIAWSERSRYVVLVNDGVADGVQTKGLAGAYTTFEALDLLLDSSGLKYKVTDDRTIVIVAALQTAAASLPSGTSDNRAERAAQPISIDGAGAAASSVRLASDSADAPAKRDEVVVTGTRIRGAAPAGAALMTMDRQALEQTGRSTLEDVLKTLPQNFPGSQNEATQLGALDSRRNLAFGSTVDLRGLGADATLTLVNGRRLAPASWGNFIDISIIPLAAIDRVEVLADGASATYGSDAVAGVVNVILRNDFEGAETAARFGVATRGDPTDVGVSQLFGRAWNSGNAMLGYEYRNRGALAAADRDFTASSDLRPFGGDDFSSTFSNPGNIVRVGAAPVALAIPRGQDGVSLSEADLIAGDLNRQNITEGNSLLPKQQSHSLFASVRQDVGASLALRGELLATRRKASSERFQNNVTMIVPETNAYRQLNNLFPGQGPLVMTYNMVSDLGPSRLDAKTKAISAGVAAEYDISRDWRIEGVATFSHHVDDTEHGNVFDSSAHLIAALASSDLAAAFNPFADGSNTSQTVLDGLTYSTFLLNDSDVITGSVKADGPLWRMWGGDARAAVGFERRRESFELSLERIRASGAEVQTAVQPGKRSTNAFFAELFLPFVGPAIVAPGVRELSVSLSVRRESPSDYASSTTPKVGVRWSIDESLSLRGTWGRSFKAPQFQQLLGGIGGTILSLPPTFDPFATGGSTSALIISGSNIELDPERARNWTAGLDFAPAWIDGLTLSATYFDIDFVDRISSPGDLLVALADPTGFEGFLIRNPTQELIDHFLAIPDTVGGVVPPGGIELIWDGRLTNLASLRVRGADINFQFARDTRIGAVSFFGNASALFEYTRQTGTAAAPIDALDTIFNPINFRARLGVSLRRDGWGGLFAANYANSYTDNISTPNRAIDAFTTVDARVTHRWEQGLLRGTQFAVNVQNLFDADPPFANNPIGYGFDSQNAAPVGRFVSFEVRRSW